LSDEEIQAIYQWTREQRQDLRNLGKKTGIKSDSE
jgi:hypothetical protein